MAYWFGFAAVAGAFGGLIAFGIQHAHSAISNWRLLFIVEGLPTILMGLISMWLLPNRPEETTFLTEDERIIQLERRSRGLKADVGRVVNKSENIVKLSERGTVLLTCFFLSVHRAHRCRIYGLENLPHGCHLLRSQLCSGFYIGFLTHYHQDLRCLYVTRLALDRSSR